MTAKVETAGAATHATTPPGCHIISWYTGPPGKRGVHTKEFTPLETKLKEIIDSYNDGRMITYEDVIFYADILRRELYKEMQLESKKEEK